MNIRTDCKWDLVSLGEVMLRLDPGEGRIRNTRHFTVWEGGGEYNVARGLKRCFGLNTSVVTAIADNEIGYLLEDLLFQGGVDTSHVVWKDFDGIGAECRVGLNFTERGFGLRGAVGVSDRARSAASLLKKGDIDWELIFGKEKAKWFHCGGIFSALSETTFELTLEAMEYAKKHGTVISYDLNYRPSLWKNRGGQKKAQEINRKIASLVDVMIGNEEDFSMALGFEADGIDENYSNLNIESFKKMIEKVTAAYPNFKAVATTLRNAKTATINDWAGILYYNDNFYESVKRENLEILDRVGGGDSFASGLIYGFIKGKTPQESVEYAALHGALAMTTAGDTSTVSLKELEKILKSGNARIER